MKNTNFNRLLMVLMVSAASVATAGVSQVKEVTVTETSGPVVYAKDLLNPAYTVNGYATETIQDPEFDITRVVSVTEEEEVDPIKFTVREHENLSIGEDASAPLMGQIEVLKEQLKRMELQEEAKDLSEVVFAIGVAESKIKLLYLLRNNPKAYRKMEREALHELGKAEHAYRKATPGLRSKK